MELNATRTVMMMVVMSKVDVDIVDIVDFFDLDLDFVDFSCSKA